VTIAAAAAQWLPETAIGNLMSAQWGCPARIA
jgi:hypothetical protein